MSWNIAYKTVGDNIVVSIMSCETGRFFSGVLSIEAIKDPIISAMFDDVEELFVTCMAGKINVVDNGDHVDFSSLMDWSIGKKTKQVSLVLSFFLVLE